MKYLFWPAVVVASFIYFGCDNKPNATRTYSLVCNGDYLFSGEGMIRRSLETDDVWIIDGVGVYKQEPGSVCNIDIEVKEPEVE